jgi:hypothetical protein
MVAEALNARGMPCTYLSFCEKTPVTKRHAKTTVIEIKHEDTFLVTVTFKDELSVARSGGLKVIK